jgi:predicted nucleic acid-binding protein
MIAFDTNILIYSCDLSDLRRQRIAFELLRTAEDGVLLWQVAIEFAAASRKLGAQGFTASQAWDRLREFMDVLPLVTPTASVLGYARDLHERSGVSFRDSLIIGACMDCGADTLYSEDLPGGLAAAQVNIVNPFV